MDGDACRTKKKRTKNDCEIDANWNGRKKNRKRASSVGFCSPSSAPHPPRLMNSLALSQEHAPLLPSNRGRRSKTRGKGRNERGGAPLHRNRRKLKKEIRLVALFSAAAACRFFSFQFFPFIASLARFRFLFPLASYCVCIFRFFLLSRLALARKRLMLSLDEKKRT